MITALLDRVHPDLTILVDEYRLERSKSRYPHPQTPSQATKVPVDYRNLAGEGT
jgi:hypothetical protein